MDAQTAKESKVLSDPSAVIDWRCVDHSALSGRPFGAPLSYMFLHGGASTEAIGGVSMSSYGSRAVGLELDTTGRLIAGFDMAIESGRDTVARTLRFMRDSAGNFVGGLVTVNHSLQWAYMRDSTSARRAQTSNHTVLAASELAVLDTIAAFFWPLRCPGRGP